jgi:hypothetical protein
MPDQSMTRSEFLRQGSRLAAMGTLGGLFSNAQAADTRSEVPREPCRGTVEGKRFATAIRPYQLLCLVCALGENEVGPKAGTLKNLLAEIRANPDAPITLYADAGVGFAFQNRAADDGDGSREFSQRRDLAILHRLDIPPGEALPARILLHRLLKSIGSVEKICGAGAATSDAWKGCAKAGSGCYERGCKRAVESLMPGRSEKEMACEKKASIDALRQAHAVRVRPHILVCSICQYGAGVRPPYKEDNLPELLHTILTDRPDLSVTLVPGADWMMCAPCPHRDPRTGWCVIGHIKSGGLYNELKDLNVLRQLGLTYGTTMKARDVYHRILEKISTVVDVCALDAGGKPPYSLWRDGCGSDPELAQKGYIKGKDALLAKLQ